ncbi:hypothetical protein Nepgr_033436 [Nepenthes gracilis]|uniref:Uncharacterized protein n=1 Tax=Nepenthes gracilis TaxID=150966 RepID=A0AAD3TMM4_NEPGR|nr:hypothetical protein Nepgr_033436 [Nepenthes gracilis]
MPILEVYDGSGDPMDHLNHFREHLNLQGLDETTMCQCFPLTLKGDAWIWFYGMPVDSICDFGDLATAFCPDSPPGKGGEITPAPHPESAGEPGELGDSDAVCSGGRADPRSADEVKPMPSSWPKGVLSSSTSFTKAHRPS